MFSLDVGRSVDEKQPKNGLDRATISGIHLNGRPNTKETMVSIVEMF